jgi:hypothetical protein
MWLKSIAENKVRGALIVCVVALVIRLIYCFTSFQNYLSNDAVGYHTLAVNVALGNGYSTNRQPPYEPHFLREPGYPLFLAAVYYVYTFFGEPHHVESNQIDIARYPEISWARVAQAVVGAATCVIFLLLLRLRLRPTAAFVIAVLFAAYLPLAAFSAIMLRETLQTFLVMVMSYAFARFLLGPRWQWLALFTVAWTLSNLTLQVTVLVFIPVFVFCWIWFRDLWRSLRYTALATVGMMVLVSPWLTRTYLYYPDMRVLRNMGTSLTFEAASYVLAQASLWKAGIIDRDTAFRNNHQNVWDLPDRVKFERSFSGYYRDEVRKAHALLTASNTSATLKLPVTFVGRAKQLFKYLRNCWIESLWVYEYPDGSFDLGPNGVYRVQKEYVMLAFSLVGFIFGYAALAGIPLFFRQLFPILLMFTYFVLLIPIIGDEERRGLPMHPFIALFSCLVFFYFYQRLIQKKTREEVYMILSLIIRPVDMLRLPHMTGVSMKPKRFMENT